MANERTLWAFLRFPMGFEAENLSFTRGIALSCSDCSITKSSIVGQKTKQRVRE